MKVSVAMATFNGEQFIREQLNSILLQTIKPDEIVICDDNSDDNTLLIINKVLKDSLMDYKIIRHKKNQGIVESFRDALSVVTGDIIFLCDQDDVWNSRKIERFLLVFEKNSDCLLTFSDAYITDENLKIMKASLWDALKFQPQNNIQNKKIFFFKEMFQRNIFTGMCMAFKSDLIAKNLICSSNMLHDEAIGWTALLNGKVIALNEKLVYYRQHSGNAVGKPKIRRFQSIQLTKYYIKQSSKKNLNKYRDIMWYVKDSDVLLLVQSAVEFNKWRVQLFDMKRVVALTKWFKLVRGGKYKIYTSKTEKAVIKDFICILL